jgi:hypothetical protein
MASQAGEDERLRMQGKKQAVSPRAGRVGPCSRVRTAGARPRSHLHAVPHLPGSVGGATASGVATATTRRRLGVGKMGDGPQRGEPERALMRAVLEDAIRCLVGEGRPLARRGRLAAQARKWVTTRDARWPYSFDNVCYALNLVPEGARRRLLGSREMAAVIFRRVIQAALAP